MRQRPEAWVDWMMRFELGLEKPEPGRALSSAVTIAISYVAGGIIPLAPYAFLTRSTTALLVSVLVTAIALAACLSLAWTERNSTDAATFDSLSADNTMDISFAGDTYRVGQ